MSDVTYRHEQLLTMSYSDYVRELRGMEGAASTFDELRIAILRSYTIEPIEPLLRFLSILEEMRPNIYIGGYNQYAQEVLDSGSGLHAFDPQVVILAVRLEELVPGFFEDREARGSDQWRLALAEAAEQTADLAARLVAANGCQVLIQNATLPASPRPPLFDAQAPGGVTDLVHGYNQALATAVAGRAGVFVWDLLSFINKAGFDQVSDPKMWFLSKNPFKLAAYPSIALDLYDNIRAMRGIVKKCIVVDLDNTLWGGVVGEDGLSGIALGHDYPGNCYREFHSLLLGFRRQGFILAVNSKNNEQDALDVFEKHPDCPLQASDFSALRINWRDKATNLVEIANELNIGIDSLIMIDDSEVECALIRQRLPDVRVYCLPKAPYEIPGFVSSIPGLQKMRVTSEDRKKGEMYRAQTVRKSAEASFGSLDDFLKSLQLRVAIQATSDFNVPRVAQLTQKTNQFNMTTRRYTEADVLGFLGDESMQVFDVSVEDRFGDYGVVGVAILKYDSDHCQVDSLLLSCRVIGRKIENALLAHLVTAATVRGVRRIDGVYLPSGKNQPAADVYRELGFVEMGEGVFSAELPEFGIEVPDFIELEVRT